MTVLVACEESQAVCIEFRKLCINAFSCDILGCSGGHPEWHIKGDVLSVLYGGMFVTESGELITVEKWDMIIAFPPCTDLAVSGAKHFAAKIADGRQQKSIDFFMRFANHPCPKIAIENPVGIMSRIWRKPDQIIQPYQHGHEATKATCLWLKGLPIILPTNIVGKGDRHTTKGGKSLPVWYNLPPGPNRARIRSKTFSGIAKAMAATWSQKNNKSSFRQSELFL